MLGAQSTTGNRDVVPATLPKPSKRSRMENRSKHTQDEAFQGQEPKNHMLGNEEGQSHDLSSSSTGGSPQPGPEVTEYSFCQRPEGREASRGMKYAEVQGHGEGLVQLRQW